MYFLRINFKALCVPESEPSPGAKAWELYARCNAESSDSCELFQQIANLTPKDRKAALSALRKLVEVAASGLPITNFYDKKQCHDIHTFNYQGKDRTVWRIWKGDVVRVTFYYGQGRTILLTHAFAKYEDKLNNAQKAMLEKEVIAYIDAVNAKTLHTFEKTDDENR
jgi:hypothetical protein